MARERVFTVQRTVYLTEAMCVQLDQLATRRGQGCKPNDLIREALRAFLDDQAEVMASRRHFQKGFQARIDLMEGNILQRDETLAFYLNVLIQMLAFGLAHLLSSMSKRQIAPQQLIQKAVVEARKEEALLAQQVQAVREMSITERT